MSLKGLLKRNTKNLAPLKRNKRTKIMKRKGRSKMSK